MIDEELLTKKKKKKLAQNVGIILTKKNAIPSEEGERQREVPKINAQGGTFILVGIGTARSCGDRSSEQAHSVPIIAGT